MTKTETQQRLAAMKKTKDYRKGYQWAVTAVASLERSLEAMQHNIHDCANCTRSEYKNFENRQNYAENIGLYCKKARMKIKNSAGMKCFEDSNRRI